MIARGEYAWIATLKITNIDTRKLSEPVTAYGVYTVNDDRTSNYELWIEAIRSAARNVKETLRLRNPSSMVFIGPEVVDFFKIEPLDH